MGKKYAVDINGAIVIWKDGKFSCDDQETLDKIRSGCEYAEKAPQLFLDLDGSTIYSGKGVNPEPSWVASYALLQMLTGGGMIDVAGDKPTWEALGYKTEENVIT